MTCFIWKYEHMKQAPQTSNTHYFLLFTAFHEKKNEYSNLTFKFLLLVWSDFKADKPNIWEEIKDNHSAACLCSDKLKYRKLFTWKICHI